MHMPGRNERWPQAARLIRDNLWETKTATKLICGLEFPVTVLIQELLQLPYSLAGHGNINKPPGSSR